MIDIDPWLEPFRGTIRHRFSASESLVRTINETEGGLDKFSKVGQIEEVL